MIRRLTRRLAACLMLFGFLPVCAWAGQQPLWEVGAGGAWIDFPKYRGSNERSYYVLPFPYLTYNGDFLQIRRQSASGLIFRRERVEMDISVSGSIPASSRDTQARSGMPNLDAAVEIGPQLKFHLYFDEKKETNLDLRLPVREAFATDLSHFQDIGWVFQPKLNLDVDNVRHSGWNMGLSVGPVYADKRYNRYFYAVDPQYVTPLRAGYAAHGGYSGYQITAALSKRHADYWTGGFVRWDNLGGAVFADSPLVRSSHYFSVGLSIAWMLGKSTQMVEVSDD